MENGEQETAMSTREAVTRVTHVGKVGVTVTDQARALEFYVGTMGFEKRVDAGYGEGDRWIEVAPPGALTTVAIIAAREGLPAGVDTGIRLITEDADGDHASLLAAGVDVDPEVLRWGGGVPPMFGFRDPDGNTLVIIERD